MKVLLIVWLATVVVYDLLSKSICSHNIFPIGIIIIQVIAIIITTPNTKSIYINKYYLSDTCLPQKGLSSGIDL